MKIEALERDKKQIYDVERKYLEFCEKSTETLRRFLLGGIIGEDCLWTKLVRTFDMLIVLLPLLSMDCNRVSFMTELSMTWTMLSI